MDVAATTYASHVPVEHDRGSALISPFSSADWEWTGRLRAPRPSSGAPFSRSRMGLELVVDAARDFLPKPLDTGEEFVRGLPWE